MPNTNITDIKRTSHSSKLLFLLFLDVEVIELLHKVHLIIVYFSSFQLFRFRFLHTRRLSTAHDSPSTNFVVSVTREQSLTIGTPSQADTLWLTALLSLL